MSCSAELGEGIAFRFDARDVHLVLSPEREIRSVPLSLTLSRPSLLDW